MNIEVKLLQNSHLSILIQAIRTCYQSYENSDSGYETVNIDKNWYGDHKWILGEKDKNLINRILESKHDSTLEHIVFTFDIKGISRLCLQELSRHRIASPSVQSTRYTLKELKNETPFWTYYYTGEAYYEWKRAEKYINLLPDPEDYEINVASIQALENLRKLICSGKYSNDRVKYCLPECYRLNEVLTINLRSLRNLLHLRKTKEAHFEIRELSEKMEDIIPEEYQFLL